MTAQVAHDFRTPVRGLRELLGSAFAFLIDSSQPRLERLFINYEDRSRLLVGPASGRLELEDAHSLDRCVTRAFARGQPTPAEILDIQFFLQQSNFVCRSLEFCTDTASRAPEF